MTRSSMPLAVVLLAVLLGCGGDKAQETGTAADAAAGNAPRTSSDIALVRNAEGHFEADWPSGTGQLRTRVVPSAKGVVENAMVRVDCVRNGDALRGCSVTVWFELPGGRVPGPEDVTLRLGNVIRENSLEVLRQFPIQRDGMEGVTAMCVDPQHDRYTWIEGFLNQGRILVTAAWDRTDALYTDTEVRDFLASVRFTD